MEAPMIPTLVMAQLDVHRVETQMKLETVKRQLDGAPVTAIQSRRLRAQRDLLLVDLRAWEYLCQVDPPMTVPQASAPCTPCGICSECGYLGPDIPVPDRIVPSAITPAPCSGCGHPHVVGETCQQDIDAVDRSVCGCTA